MGGLAARPAAALALLCTIGACRVGYGGAGDSDSGDAGDRDAAFAAGRPVIEYRFQEGAGPVVTDTGGGQPYDLTISDLADVSWSADGLRVLDSAGIAGADPPQKLLDACRASRSFSVEACLTPDGAVQGGPARIVTLAALESRSANFMLGHGASDSRAVDAYVFRLAGLDDDGDGGGLESLSGSALETRQHLVGVYDTQTRARQVYVDGQLYAQQIHVSDADVYWSDAFVLSLANEWNELSRPWLGTLHYVAIYCEALDAAFIAARASCP